MSMDRVALYGRLWAGALANARRAGEADGWDGAWNAEPFAGDFELTAAYTEGFYQGERDFFQENPELLAFAHVKGLFLHSAPGAA